MRTARLLAVLAGVLLRAPLAPTAMAAAAAPAPDAASPAPGSRGRTARRAPARGASTAARRGRSRGTGARRAAARRRARRARRAGTASRAAGAAAAAAQPTVTPPARPPPSRPRGRPSSADRDRRQPPRRARRRHLVPAREGRPALQGREPHERRARPLGLGLLRGHPGRPDDATTAASSCASSCASGRTSRTIEFEGNDEIDNDKLNEAVEIKPNTILSVPAVRRSVQKIKDAYAEKGYFLADVDFTSRAAARERGRRQVQDRRAPAGDGAAHHVHRQRARLRRRAARPDADRQRRLPLVRVGRALPAGRLRARRADAERPLLRQGLPQRADRHAARDAHARPRRASTSPSPSTRGRASRSASCASTSATTTARRSSRSAAGARCAQMIHAQSGDYFNRAELIKDLQAVRTLYRDAGFANVEAEPETELDPVHERGRHRHPDPARAAGPHRAHRDQGQHQDARQGHPPRDGDPGGAALQRDAASRTASGASRRSATSSASTSRPSRARRPTRSSSTSRSPRSPTGTFQVGAGFSSIENFIATAQVQQANLFGNGQSLALQAQVSALRQLVSLRFFEPYFLDSRLERRASELYDKLYVFPNFARRSRRRLAHLRLRAHPAVAPPSSRRPPRRTRSTRRRVNTFFGTTPGLRQRLPAAPAREPLQRRAARLAPPDHHLRHARQPPLPVVGHLPPGLDRARERSPSAASSTSSATASRGASTTRSAAATGSPGSGFVLKLNTEFGLITSPTPQGVPIFAALLPRRHPRRPRLPPAQHRPAPAAQHRRSTRTRRPSPTARTSAATSRRTRTSSSSSRSSTRSASAASSSSTPATRGTPSSSSARRRRRRSSTRSCQPCFNASQPRRTCARATGFGIRWFSPLGPLRFEWGFPLAPLPYEKH